MSTSTIIGVATRQTSATRAKDSDRNDTCQILDSALAEGQLSMTEHGERVKAATTATTLGELQALVSDLQTNNAPVQLPTLRKPRTLPMAGNGWGLRLAVAGVLLVLGIAIGWGLYGNTPSPLNFTSDPGAKSDGITPVVLTPPKQLHSLGGLTGLLEQMKQRFGDTNGYRLVVYPDYASLTRPDPAEERRELNYTYRGGWDDPSSTSKSSSAVEVDLSKFDAKAVVGVLRGAPETLGMKPEDVTSTYLSIDPATDPTTPGALSVDVYVSSDYGSGYIELAGDGTVKQINYPG
ncbi:hypothetical protein AU184_26805 [Mycolicibacterium novocastrense]|nr:hypothetical protein AU183_04595 [Mycolicibacterium novocastrense]KUH68708.1 hypothetical protein AU184_26805 [Mycolicibacterium novocastrense]KUH74451.1 hypothetical protein AU072_17160 [Mycolicibacterium novocastrense]